jgi:hypothetical protein
MKSAKEALRQTIETLSEEEARQVLDPTRRVRRGKRDSRTLRRLSHDLAFSVPRHSVSSFGMVTPVHGKGSPASRLLERDRR